MVQCYFVHKSDDQICVDLFLDTLVCFIVSLSTPEYSEKEMATLPREFRGQRSLVGCCPWDRTESDMTEAT